MLPFARMLAYGNKIEVNKIKKSVNCVYLEMILTENGTLYAHGEDSSYSAGQSTPFSAYGELKTISENVQDVWLGSYSVIIKDGKIYGSGPTMSFTKSNAIQQGYTDWSGFFAGIDVTQIKKMLCGYTTFVLMNDGTLYGRGLNRNGCLGLGHKNFVSQWTKLDTEVDSIYGHYIGDSIFKVKSNGTVWGAGANNSYQIKATTGDATTFVPLFDNIPYDITFCVGFGIGFVMGTTDNKIYVTGTTLSGTGKHSKIFDINFTIGDMSNVYPKYSPFNTGSVIFLVNSDTNKLMSTGYTPFTGSSVSSIPFFDVFQECQFPDFNINLHTEGSTWWSTFYDDTNIWMNGQPPSNLNGRNASMCSIPLSMTFTKQIDLPF